MTHCSQFKFPKKPSLLKAGSVHRISVSKGKHRAQGYSRVTSRNRVKKNTRRLTQKSKYWNNCCKGEDKRAKGAVSA